MSPRHLTRLLTTEVGASPGQLARTRRAHTARMLIEQTDLPLTEIAFAAGFGSIRQFNDVMRTEFGLAPREIRRTKTPAERKDATAAPTLVLRLRFRPPIDAAGLRAALTAHAIDGVEHVTDTEHMRALDTTRPSIARFRIDPLEDSLALHLTVTDLRDISDAVVRMRRWLDLDADPAQIDAHLAPDPLLAPLVRARPGIRVPGAVDGAELAVCAVLGQQVSLANARTFQSRIARAFGTPVPLRPAVHDGEAPFPPLVTFPRPEVLAAAGPQAIRDAANLTQARARAVHAVATACANGLSLAPGLDPLATRRALTALPGIGPWTADYLALRALHDPDAFMPSDLVARKALAALTAVPLGDLTAAAAERASHPWRPWRAYALQHLWTATAYAPPGAREAQEDQPGR